MRKAATTSAATPTVRQARATASAGLEKRGGIALMALPHVNAASATSVPPALPPPLLFPAHGEIGFPLRLLFSTSWGASLSKSLRLLVASGLVAATAGHLGTLPRPLLMSALRSLLWASPGVEEEDDRTHSKAGAIHVPESGSRFGSRSGYEMRATGPPQSWVDELCNICNMCNISPVVRSKDIRSAKGAGPDPAADTEAEPPLAGGSGISVPPCTGDEDRSDALNHTSPSSSCSSSSWPFDEVLEVFQILAGLGATPPLPWLDALYLEVRPVGKLCQRPMFAS